MSHQYAHHFMLLGFADSSGMGRTNERIGRIQETYVANATSSWLESLERSLAQMKDYQVCPWPPGEIHILIIKQAARKKLENRRLAYDTSLAKMQKAKREDFQAEEELRIQKAKYEETSEDVHRRMQDVSMAVTIVPYYSDLIERIRSRRRRGTV